MESDLVVNILTDLAKMSPTFAVLIYFVVYFKNRAEQKDAEIKELMKESRELEKENINVLNRLADAINSIKELVKK